MGGGRGRGEGGGEGGEGQGGGGPPPPASACPPLVAHCHLGLGKLYRRTGKRKQAQERLTSATTMYREMDMGFWLEQAQLR